MRALARIAKRRGIAAWIVGGAVRDCVLGLPSSETDVAVARDAEGLAHELEKEGVGRAVFLSRGRPGPRVFRVAGKRLLDIAEIEGESITADLARRDFTVNAMAVALDSGDLLDPFGGLGDLALRRLSCAGAGNMIADPLRTLRAARFFAAHGLRPDRATLDAARGAAPLLPRVAPERIGSELAKLLASPKAAPALSWAHRAGILSSALGIALTPATAAALLRSLTACDRTARALTPDRRRRLRLSLVAFRLHQSSAATRGWLRSLRWARRESDEVARLSELAASAGGIRTRREAWRWIVDAGVLGGDALRLLDDLGPAARRSATKLRRLWREPLQEVRVTGDDVVRWLGLCPGPLVGELLTALRVEAAAGGVRNRREARHWLTVQVPLPTVTGYNS